MADTDDAHWALRTIQNLSVHLDQLAGRVHLVEEALGDSLVGQRAFTGVPLTTLQSLDYTRQSLEDCALLLHLMSKSKSKGPELSLTAEQSMQLKLSTTRDLLQNSANRHKEMNSGEVDLF